jgi:hypothetical protein
MQHYPQPVRVDRVRGDLTGLEIPAHGEALLAAGTDFLTAAFHRFGSLPPDNRVVRIAHAAAFSGGNSGSKLAFSVEYAKDAPELHRDLFVKFSRDFGDAFRDRRRDELEAEVRFAALSRLPQFPICVPAAYFADFNGAAGTGLLITQAVAFGRDGIEPLHHKCMDHELPDSLPYYRAILTTLARLAAAYKAGRLAPQVDALFPFDAAAAAAEDPIPWNESQVRELCARLRDFAKACPNLLPAHLRTPQFLARFEEEAVRFLNAAPTVKRYLHADPDYIALCHYNANIDNAWFWTDGSGVLQCGLLDWGRVRPMNTAYSIWGSLCQASLELWDRDLGDLLALFVTQLRTHGGPQLEVDELKLHLHCYVATMGLATIIQAPGLILSRLPEVKDASGVLDPVMFKDEVARNFLHTLTAFLNLWQRHDFGASLDRVLARSAAA